MSRWPARLRRLDVGPPIVGAFKFLLDVKLVGEVFLWTEALVLAP